MKMLFAILQLLYPAAIMLIPVLFYRKRPRFPMRFYRGMACSPAVRRSYMVMLAVLVLLFNFTFTRTTGPSWWLALGFLYGLLLLRYGFTDATLCWLHDDRVIQCFHADDDNAPGVSAQRLPCDDLPCGDVLSVT